MKIAPASFRILAKATSDPSSIWRAHSCEPRSHSCERRKSYRYQLFGTTLPLILLLALAAPAIAADDHPVIPVWENGAPHSNGRQNEEVIVNGMNGERPFLHLTGIHQPTLTVYLPPPETATGTGIVILPGGGHRYLQIDLEGTEIAEWLNRQGIAGFVLKYRLAREPGSPYTMEDEVADASRAIRLVRARATEFGLDPARIGITGYSAGGELAAYVSTRFQPGDPNADDPLMRVSSRPDFQIMGYPSFEFAADAVIPADTPPAFITCAQDDARFVYDSPSVFLTLTRAHVPVELHIYQRGAHGFAVRDFPGPIVNWKRDVLAWMADIGAYSPRR